MLALAYIVSFVVGFGLGAWRAGRSSRGAMAIAALPPLAVLLLTGLMVLFLVATSRGNAGMNELAYIVVTIVGCGLAVCSWFGGLFGVWFGRADRAAK